MKVEYDTGSPLVWFQSKNNCSSCPSPGLGFDTEKSESFHIIDEEKPEIIEYGRGKVEGLWAKDTVCLAPKDQDLCFNEFKFVSAYEIVDLSDAYLGIVGMSPKASIL